MVWFLVPDTVSRCLNAFVSTKAVTHGMEVRGSRLCQGQLVTRKTKG